MFNWSLSQAKVTAAIRLVGFQVTLTKADDSTAKAYAVWDSSTKNDLREGSPLTGNQKQIYIAANIKKVPVPGDYISQGTDMYSVVQVEAYRPATVTLAYRVVVQ